MSESGWVVFVLGFVAALVGLAQRRRLAKMLTVPHRAPSEIARLGAAAGDAKAMVSTEGRVIAQRPLVAPMSGKPCLAYEVTIERRWEKDASDGKGGVSTSSGTDVMHRHYEGAPFQIADANAAVWVDPSKQPDAPLEKSYSNTERLGLIAPAAVAFGGMQFQLPLLPRDSRTTAIVGSEKILTSATGAMFALGGLEQTPNGPVIATPKGLTTGRLMLSSQGRDHLLGTAQRNAKVAFVAAAALAVIGLPMGIFGSHASAHAQETPRPVVASVAWPVHESAVVPTAPTGAIPLALGALVHGAVPDADPNQPARTGGQAAVYTIALTAGQPVTIFTRGGPVVGSTPDSHLDVVTELSHDGAVDARDDDGGGGTDSRIAFTPTTTANYTIRVTGFVGSAGVFTLQALPGTLASEHAPAPRRRSSRGF